MPDEKTREEFFKRLDRVSDLDEDLTGLIYDGPGNPNPAPLELQEKYYEMEEQIQRDGVEEILYQGYLDEDELKELEDGTLIRSSEDDRLIYMKVMEQLIPYMRKKLKQPERELTKYGSLRKGFIMNYKPNLELELGDDLLIHCLEIQDQAEEMKRNLMEQLEKKDPPPELGTLEWVQHMNYLDSVADEIVMSNLINS